jgi:hypothetical protein
MRSVTNLGVEEEDTHTADNDALVTIIFSIMSTKTLTKVGASGSFITSQGHYLAMTLGHQA